MVCMPSVEYSCQQMKKAQLRLAIGASERNRLNSGLTSIIPILKNEGEDIPASLFCVEPPSFTRSSPLYLAPGAYVVRCNFLSRPPSFV